MESDLTHAAVGICVALSIFDNWTAFSFRALKKFVFILFAVPVLIVVFLVLTKMRWKFSKPVRPPVASQETVATNVAVTVESTSGSVRSVRSPLLLGETILRDYANTNLPPENDLTLMSRLMENSLLLLKAAANRPLSANEDWADLFRGKNAAREEFLPAQHVAFNPQGQLVDRWKSPLFFHALGGGRFEIRAAGPDQKLWTADDIHRNADGSFRRGPDLTNAPASLFR